MINLSIQNYFSFLAPYLLRKVEIQRKEEIDIEQDPVGSFWEQKHFFVPFVSCSKTFPEFQKAHLNCIGSSLNYRHNNLILFLSSLTGSKALTQVKDGNFRVSTSM